MKIYDNALKNKVRSITSKDNMFYDKKRGYYCRDIFANQGCLAQFDFVYVNDNLSNGDIIKFLLKLEKHLEIKEHSKFGKLQTRLSKALYKGKELKYKGFVIHPSSFWREHKLKYSFLTGVLKIIVTKNSNNLDSCYHNFTTSNIYKLISKGKVYFNRTSNATKKFLNGDTKVVQNNLTTCYSYSSSGWQYAFTNHLYELRNPNE